jgi:pimeloyl-ACP methyl ester carboxylesterase
MLKYASALLIFLPVAASASDTHSRFATLDGSRIHYLSYGEGREAAVFIHGWTCDSTFWRFQAPVYEHRRSLVIDLPGHGLSDKPQVSYTMEYFARAVEAAMEDAGVDRATLIGHSMGTPVAVQFLRMFPVKVSGLFVVDGFIPGPPKDDAEKKKQAAQAAMMIKMYRGPDYKDNLGRMLDSMFTPETPESLREDVVKTMLSTPQFVVASAMEGMMAFTPVRERWHDVPVAATMVKRDSSEQFRTFLKSHFELVRYEDFDHAGHFLMMEQPEKFNAILASFLDGRAAESR